jgi:RNA polymerase subunit RPABC4/transcription elongation factor Spt4
MALINCKDCNSEISDSAEACPKCGAPVPKIIGEDEEQCPHCMTVIHQDATKCPGCRAVKGYFYDSRYGALGKTSTIGWAIFTAILGLIFTPATNSIFLILVLVAAYAFYRVFVTGQRWYASKGAN